MLPSESPEAAVQTDLEAQEPDEGTHHIIGPISIPCKRIRELSRRTSTVLFNASNLGSATRPAHVTFLGCVAAVRASYDREVLFLRKIIVITASNSRLTILLTVAMYRKGEASNKANVVETGDLLPCRSQTRDAMISINRSG